MLVEKLTKLGHSIRTISREIGCHYTSFTRWLKEDARLLAAYESGLARREVLPLTKLRAKIHNGDLGAIIFFLKSRCGWSEKHVVEHDIKRGEDYAQTAEVLDNLSPTELRELKDLLSRAKQRGAAEGETGGRREEAGGTQFSRLH